MYFCSRISVPCFFNDAFLLCPYLNILVWLKRRGMAGQLGGCAPFSVLAGIGKGKIQLSEIPLFRIQPYSSWHVITYAPSYCLGLLRKMCLSKECAPWAEILPWGSGLGPSPWQWWVYYSEGSGWVLSRCSVLQGFLQQATVNELMPGRSAAFGDVLWPRVKICLWSWQCEFCVCLYHISSVVISEQ